LPLQSANKPDNKKRCNCIYYYKNNNIDRKGAGNDIVSGSPGDDSLVGNDGDDDLYGGPGRDQFWCNSGVDTIHDYSLAEGDKIMSKADCEIVIPSP
jgi:Ca2+-binding RTX toxin-like protein